MAWRTAGRLGCGGGLKDHAIAPPPVEGRQGFEASDRQVEAGWIFVDYAYLLAIAHTRHNVGADQIGHVGDDSVDPVQRLCISSFRRHDSELVFGGDDLWRA